MNFFINKTVITLSLWVTLYFYCTASFAQQGFSRDMEREADTFALTQLESLGYSSNDFADAIEALQESHTSENEHLEKVNDLLEYLSSHPSAQERIDNARK